MLDCTTIGSCGSYFCSYLSAEGSCSLRSQIPTSGFGSSLRISIVREGEMQQIREESEKVRQFSCWRANVLLHLLSLSLFSLTFLTLLLDHSLSHFQYSVCHSERSSLERNREARRRQEINLEYEMSALRCGQGKREREGGICLELEKNTRYSSFLIHLLVPSPRRYNKPLLTWKQVLHTNTPPKLMV